ncbi:MAG: shikimate dehydrogenase [Oscillospiraceae bacterium]|nr:shikimate dehydrogenase [Ruminococcus sp.]MDD6098469.1 shikimate dehydrogenase [Oscillospiraceae bacterium]
MKKYALIGHPLGHSMSPLIHYRMFGLSGCEECVYELTDIAPENLESSMENLRTLSGFNITIPHKVSIIPMLDSLDESAARYNAVNCVKNDNGKLIGYNTDCYGFLKSVENMPLDGNVLLLGCGGAGRMMGIEAARHGASLTIAVRNSSVKKAQLLMAEILSSCSSAKVRITDISGIEGSYDLLLNATPVGMYPNVQECPVSHSIIERCGSFFDAIYNPTDTVLLKTASNLGKPAVGGAAMLVYQAAKAHEIWDGDTYTPEQLQAIIAETENAVETMQRNT